MIIASAKKRLLAGLIDSIIYACLFVLFIYLFKDCAFFETIKEYLKTKLFNFNINEFNKLLIDISTNQSFYFFLCELGVYMLYFIGLPLLTDGRTLGRLLFGIRIVKLNNTKASFGTLLIREVIVLVFFTVFTFGLFRILELILIFNSKGRRTIADKMSNTLVMENGYKIK